jgi:DNA polymerase IV (archaeal DinB-like DNA polymerase)
LRIYFSVKEEFKIKSLIVFLINLFMRIILHVDMDAFFTSVEEKHNTSLNGKPVVVGADPKNGIGRGVVSAANYEARKFGINSAMPISKAYKLCPHAVFLPVNFPLYYKTSYRIMKILRKHADKTEQISVDEAFLDVSKRAGDYKNAEEIAKRIKKEIMTSEDISCSVGIGPNKLIAKIASEHDKPDGLTTVRENEIKEFLYPLDVRKLYGVGKKTEEALKELGVHTVGDLARYDRQLLINYFGKWGLAMHLLANGVDNSDVEEYREIKSISREFTFEEDTSEMTVLEDVLNQISEDLHSELGNYSFRTVALKIRFSNFETHTRQKTLSRQSQDINDIKSTAKKFLSKFLTSRKKIRLIGIKQI